MFGARDDVALEIDRHRVRPVVGDGEQIGIVAVLRDGLGESGGWHGLRHHRSERIRSGAPAPSSTIDGAQYGSNTSPRGLDNILGTLRRITASVLVNKASTVIGGAFPFQNHPAEHFLRPGVFIPRA
jgi:hypothetical protein